MIETKRRTVYVVRGRTMLTMAGAYRREAWRQLHEESAECNDCVHCHVYDGEPCEYWIDSKAVDARAGELFERDFGARREG